MTPTLHSNRNSNSSAATENKVTPFSPAELIRRRQASRRLAWALGATALAFYVIGFFLQR